MSLVLVTAPDAEPIEVADAKLHLRVETDFTDDDELITSLIAAARQFAEAHLNRPLINQVWRLSLDCFPCDDVIELGKPSVSAIGTATYANDAGEATDFSNFSLDADAFPARIVRDYGTTWPIPRVQRNAVKITFTCGYGADGTAVPAAIIAAMKLLIGHWYENREAINIGNIVSSLPAGVEALLAPYRFLEVP